MFQYVYELHTRLYVNTLSKIKLAHKPKVSIYKPPTYSTQMTCPIRLFYCVNGIIFNRLEDNKYKESLWCFKVGCLLCENDATSRVKALRYFYQLLLG